MMWTEQELKRVCLRVLRVFRITLDQGVLLENGCVNVFFVSRLRLLKLKSVQNGSSVRFRLLLLGKL